VAADIQLVELVEFVEIDAFADTSLPSVILFSEFDRLWTNNPSSDFIAGAIP